MSNYIYKFMKQTMREVAKEGILEYLKEYSYPDEIIHSSNAHLSLLRMGGHDPDKVYNRNPARRHFRGSVLSSLGRTLYETIAPEGDWKLSIPFLASAELLLTSTYLIDDIADKQDERFGDKATWKKYGLNEAMFAAFRLREIAEQIILTKTNTSLEQKLLLVGLLSEIHMKTYEGQSLNDKLIQSFDEQTYLERCRFFGGVFCRNVTEGIAILANASLHEKDSAKNLGNNYGIAIMIRNDLKDYLPSALIQSNQKISKALQRVPMEDFRIGRITYPLQIALMNGDESTLELRSLFGKQELSAEEEKKVLGLITKTPAFEKTIALIDNYKEKALVCCNQFNESQARTKLIDLIKLLDSDRRCNEQIKNWVHL